MKRKVNETVYSCCLFLCVSAADQDDKKSEEAKNDLASQILAGSDKPATAEDDVSDNRLRGSPVLVQNKRQEEENEAAAARAAAASKHGNRSGRKEKGKQTMSLDEFCGNTVPVGFEETGR